MYNLYVSYGSASINVNGEVGPYFQTEKYSAGRSHIPLLYNTLVDMLDILINRAKAECQVWGTVPHAAMLPSSRRFIYNRICL